MINICGKRRMSNPGINSVEEQEIISAIKNSINATVPDDMLSNRILRKIELKSSSPKRTFLSIRKIAAALTLAVLLFSAGSLINNFNLPTGKGNIAILKKALAAVQKPNMITYYRVGNEISAFGKRDSVSRVEFWLSPDDGKVKFVEHFINKLSKKDQPKMTKYTAIISDERVSYAREWDGKKIEVEEFSVKDSLRSSNIGFRGYLIEAAINYSKLLKESKLKVVDEERVNGIDTFKLEPVKVDSTIIATVNISKKNYQPVRIVHRVTQKPNENKPTEAGGPEPDRNQQTVTYEDISIFEEASLVSPSTIGNAFFSIDNELKGRDYRLDITYSLEEARRFEKFDLFYLGESFMGYNLDVSQGVYYHHRLKEAIFPEERLPNIYPYENVGMSYIPSKDVDNSAVPISLGIFPAMTASEISELIAAKDLANLVKTSFIVDGNEAILVEGNYKGLASGYSGYTSEIYLNRGNATIRIEAANKDLVLKAAKNLKELN